MPAITPAQAALAEALAAETIGRNRSLHIMPFYISGFIDSMLMGLVIAQAVSYCRRFYRSEKKHILGLVIMAVVGTIAASICLLLWMSHIFVYEFGHFMVFAELPYLSRYMYINTFTTLAVQAFYIDRACRLFKHWWPALLIGPFSLTAAATTLGFVIMGFEKTFYMIPELLEVPVVHQLGNALLYCSIITDALITVVIGYGLFRVRTGWSHTDSVIRRLIIQVFEAQVPALVNVVAAYISWRQSFEIALPFMRALQTIVILIQTKIYSLGLLITLNLRPQAATTGGGIEVSYPLNSVPRSSRNDAHSTSSMTKAEMDSATQGKDEESAPAHVSIHPSLISLA
ncbi:uncharacterized protein MKK02DRAFT_39971 [Dioszegia hungarica]|uniref:DUF6534 domain-containing protein n=1 Tax=Dioszegia hungarica TaxID=4972 RepID=A0AA38HGC6_9TREE|nr:uncharacterized protein MKK02DRAFT_39971 [Dioszegia hungarica]KAI9639648.1 hypothetical protein MKK02DRAFT_39971 [Dioszegia hungarica]